MLSVKTEADNPYINAAGLGIPAPGVSNQVLVAQVRISCHYLVGVGIAF